MALLRIQQVKKMFPRPDGAFHVVLDVEGLALEAGEELALAGESGSGKTTLLNLIAGIVTPEQGHIFVEGTDVTTLGESARDRWRAATIGYVFQSFNLLQGYTCLENVLLAMSFGRGVDRARAESLLRRVGLGEMMRRRPRELSSGQQQRVAVARALANQPRLVLADEPTGHLDSRHAREVVALMRETCREAGAALLLVSHDREVLAGFRRVEPMKTLNRAIAVPEVAVV